MSKIPTAEEYFKTEFEIWTQEYPELKSNVERKIKEFTKIHVKEALKTASESSKLEVNNDILGKSLKDKVSYSENGGHGMSNIYTDIKVSKDSILNCYPDSNIK